MSSLAPDDPEFENSIERHVLDVAFLRDLPEASITACIERYDEAAPYLFKILRQMATGAADADDLAEGLFRGLHIMGAVRDTQAFEPLLQLLRQRPEDTEWLLGDATTETLPRLLISTFDGNGDALLAAILDREVNEFARDSLLRAATFLSWEGRMDRRQFVEFLEQFGSGECAAADEFVWHAWVDAIAQLGLRQLVPLVEGVQKRGLIDDSILEREAFDARLAQAERDPSDASDFKRFHLGYLDDALQALRLFPVVDDEDGREDMDADEGFRPEPVINPWRNVGRNDPCPCGSGKKAKRCCLAA